MKWRILTVTMFIFALFNLTVTTNVQAQSAVVYLSDLTWTGTPSNGWGPVEKDKSNGEQAAGDGKTLTLNGTTYAKGLGVNAPSTITYNLNKAYSTFLSDIGVDDEVGSQGSVVFQLIADGVKIYDSGTMTGASTTKSINVSVANVTQLQLIVTIGPDNYYYDHADWANARLVPVGNLPATSTPTKVAPTATVNMPTSTPTSVPPTATPSGVTLYPLKANSNNRYLTTQNGTPFLMVGDAGWSLIAQVNNSDAVYYLNDRQARGFNTILIELIEHRYATNAPRNFYGDAPFTGAPFTTPNEAYFAHADYVISQAASRNMVVLLDPLYVGWQCNSDGWCAEMKAASTNDMATWGTYVGNRYKNYANIIWLIGGDTDPVAQGVGDKVSAFANALKAADPNHFITAHNDRGQMAVTPYGSPAWLTLNNIYPQNITYPLAQSAYTRSPVMPFFNVESYYENDVNGMTRQTLRAQAYWSVLYGAFGYIFGNCPLWNLGADTGYCASYADWKQSLTKPGSSDMTLFKNLFTAYAWQNLVPDFNHALLTAGYGTNGGSNYATAAVTADGSLAMVYAPSLRTLTIDLSKMRGTTTAKWFDPSNGAYTTIGTFANSGAQQFTLPGNNAGGDGDWVLVLQAP